MITKSETNNAIITTLSNVRKHPNADRLKLATVLGTQVVVGVDAKDGDVVVYFDSNLALSNDYLFWNNLYSDSDRNSSKKKGYFGNNGRVRTQRYRGEISNGFVAELYTLNLPGIDEVSITELTIGDEFTHIDGVEICHKYVSSQNLSRQSGLRNRIRKTRTPTSIMFKQHWDTKQFMRELDSIPTGIVYIEEKIHGTSGRTGNVLCNTGRPWWKFWAPKQEWRIVSGNRRVDHIDNHLSSERNDIHELLSPHLKMGETVYYEVFGSDKNGKPIQPGFMYNCNHGEYKVMIYRITITTLDGYTIDLPREAVYSRARDLGCMPPILLDKMAIVSDYDIENDCNDSFNSFDLSVQVKMLVVGNSSIANHIKEGVVVWFQRNDGTWSCLKHKSDDFLLTESKYRDDGGVDVEDNL